MPGGGLMMGACSGLQGPRGQSIPTTTKVEKWNCQNCDMVCFIGGTHLSNQQYSNCIRPEQGYCSIAYSSCTTTSFKMGNPSTAAPAFSLGDACVTDYVIISGQQKGFNFRKECQLVFIPWSGSSRESFRSCFMGSDNFLNLFYVHCHEYWWGAIKILNPWTDSTSYCPRII